MLQAGVDASRDACEWAPAFRPLQGQEWLGVAVLPLAHPLLPARSRVSVYATRRPGGPYADAPEFWASYGSGAWERSTLSLIRSVLRARPAAARTHWDIGAWIGPTALFAAHYASRVVALEPDPRAFSELLGNVRLNAGLAASARLAPYRHCLAARGGRVEMTGPAGSSMSRVHGLARVPAAAGSEPNWGGRMATWSAECSTPAAFAERVGLTREELALIKIDVEGAEAVLLPLLVEWLRGAPRRPAILLELHRALWLDHDADAARIAAALATFAHVRFVATRRSREDPTFVGPQELVAFDPIATLAEVGDLCLDDSCVVLAADDEFTLAATV